MGKFYLNNYNWIEILITIIFAIVFVVFYPYLKCLESQEYLDLSKLLKASESLFGAIASLLGFVFATITILIGLGDTYKTNNTSKDLISIIEKLRDKDKINLNVEESAKVKNKHNASSLFFLTDAYKQTLESLFGCVRILSIAFVISLIINIFGIENRFWSTIIIMYLTMSLFSVIRILFLMGFLVKILTNTEKSDK